MTRTEQQRANEIAELQGRLALAEAALRVGALHYIQHDSCCWETRDECIEKWKDEACKFYPALLDSTGATE